METKRSISQSICGKIVEKYRRLSHFSKNIVPIITERLRLRKQKGEKRRMRKRSELFKSEVENFLNENSTIDPSKKGCKKIAEDTFVTKRYLNASKLDLYHKFCQEKSLVMSFSTFAKYCPKHFVAPKINERDTCACPIHVNFSFLIDSLHRVGVLKETSATQFVRNVTCDKITVKCLNRVCSECEHKKTVFDDVSDLERNVSFKKWITKTEERISGKADGKKIIVTFITQEEKTCKILELIELLKSETKDFLDHNARVLHQFNAIKSLKQTLKTDICQCLYLWDFSQNYLCKYKTEVQSMHFGAAREQVSIHTGYLHSKTINQGYGTLSKDLDHKSAAVTAHIQKVLDIYQPQLGSINTIHFLSDSPSSQYRNQSTFYLFTQYLMENFPQIEYFTHNYSETHHGKDEADSVGATIKTAGDNAVKYNTDIPNFEKFLSVLHSKTSKILVSSISSDDINKVKNVLKEKSDFLKPFKGTMKVHQFTWKKSSPKIVQFNSLSCFDCPPGSKCAHFHLGQIDYSQPKLKKKTKNTGTSTKTSKKDKSSPETSEMSLSNENEFSSCNENSNKKIKKVSRNKSLKDTVIKSSLVKAKNILRDQGRKKNSRKTPYIDKNSAESHSNTTLSTRRSSR